MFEHINLNQVDDSQKPIDAGVYTFEVNSLKPKTIKVKKETSPLFGQELDLVEGSYTIVDDEKYSGRKLWRTFWMNKKYDLIFLKKQAAATGITQGVDEDFAEYTGQFALLNPPARFQAPLDVKKPYNDPEGAEINEMNFFQAKPV